MYAMHGMELGTLISTAARTALPVCSVRADCTFSRFWILSASTVLHMQAWGRE